MKNILNEILNPAIRFGRRKYSYRLPTIGTMAVILILEIFGDRFADSWVGWAFTILIFVMLVVYFSLRDGMLGGAISTLLALGYYIHVIYGRGFEGTVVDKVETALIILGLTYLTMAAAVGWLRQKIDNLIAESREGERRLQTILNQLPVGIVVRNRKGKTEILNRHFSKIFDVKSEGTEEFISKILNSEKNIINHEYKIRKPGGREAYIHASAVNIINDNNQMIGSAVIVSDVSRLKEMERKKDDFVNMANHELKTPITSIKLYLDLLSANTYDLNPEIKQIINSLRLQTNRLQKLAADLVDASKISVGKFSFNKKEVELEGLITETLADLNRTTAQPRIKLIKSEPVKVWGDKFRIYQVLTNIVINALKYSPSPTPVEVSLVKSAKEAVVSVRDQGMGIARDQQKKIFQRLYQVSTYKQSTFPGLGMGLYISREIIRRHHGRIWVESEPGKGSVFYFTLPTA